jgi:hypothetical protein
MKKVKESAMLCISEKPQTRKQKIAMYMKCPKKELAEMLVTCNEIIKSLNNPTYTASSTGVTVYAKSFDTAASCDASKSKSKKTCKKNIKK